MRLVTLVALGLCLAVTTSALAEPVATAPTSKKAKKCFKKKHGKRVRVKCKKKRAAPKSPSTQTPSTPAPTTPAAPDPAKDRMAYLLSGEMMRNFASSADPGGFQGQETLHTCSNKTYAYFSQFSGSAGGLTQTNKSQDAGTWEITQAEFTPDNSELFGKIKLTPSDGSTPYEIAINLVDDGSGGIITLLNKERWFRVASTSCA